MSLYGYKKKTKPALWTSAFPSQAESSEPEPVARRSVKAISNRQAERNKDYEAEKRRWWKTVAGTDCPVMKAMFGKWMKVERSPHHMRGRSGSLLCDSRHWLAVSKPGHNWIHENPEAAREMGWLAKTGDWGRESEKTCENGVKITRKKTVDRP